jgi:UDP-N-acetyl-D-glucosamine dehydrogenase
VRGRASFELIEKLEAMGAKVDYNDPHVPKTHRMRNYDLQMTSVPLKAESLRSYDCVLVSTHHSAYDWRLIAENSSLVIDTRGALRQLGRRENVASA